MWRTLRSSKLPCTAQRTPSAISSEELGAFLFCSKKSSVRSSALPRAANNPDTVPHPTRTASRQPIPPLARSAPTSATVAALGSAGLREIRVEVSARIVHPAQSGLGPQQHATALQGAQTPPPRPVPVSRHKLSLNVAPVIPDARCTPVRGTEKPLDNVPNFHHGNHRALLNAHHLNKSNVTISGNENPAAHCGHVFSSIRVLCGYEREADTARTRDLSQIAETDAARPC